MKNLNFAHRFQELKAYRLSQELSREVFAVTRSFPREETYPLTDQFRRSSRAIGANIAEAWGKRRYEKHFVSKLTDAIGEQHETVHWIETAADCRYLSQKETAALRQKCERIGQMLGGMIAKSSQFCNRGKIIEDGASNYNICQQSSHDISI